MEVIKIANEEIDITSQEAVKEAAIPLLAQIAASNFRISFLERENEGLSFYKNYFVPILILDGVVCFVGGFITGTGVNTLSVKLWSLSY